MALSIDTLTASTMYYQSKQMSDEVTACNPLLTQLDGKGKKVAVRGGTELREPVMYDGSALQWFDGMETLSHAQPETSTCFVYNWKFAQVPVVISKKEELINADSEERMFELLGNRIDGAKAKMKNGMNTAFMGDGTAFGGKCIMGLSGLFPASNTAGSLGTIARSGNSFAQHLSYSFSTDLTKAWSITTIQEGLLAVWMQIARGGDEPDIYLMTRTPFSYYHQSLTPIQVATKADSALRKAGNKTLEYMGGEVVLANGYGDGAASTELIYALNTNYMKLKYHPDLWMKRLGSIREPKDQAGSIQYIGAAGTITCNAPNFIARIAA
jgi:hypothetical protein